MPQLKIGHLTPIYPIIQGGMAVNVSTASLASAVAMAGGIGIIGASGLSPEEVVTQIRKAREASQGIIGVNIMVALTRFLDIARAAVKEKIDILIAGAGFSKDVFKLAEEAGVLVVPVVSSVKVAVLSEKLGAAGVIVEGRDAGGHLGTDKSVWDLIPEIKKAVSIPVIAAGGITTGEEIARLMFLGADGVQLGNRFVLSEECDVSPVFKEVFLNASQDDVVMIQSPVGLLGSAIRTAFVEKVLSNDPSIRPKICDNCLKHCSKSFCILTALKNARQGDLENGLFFAGRNVFKIKNILPVKDIITGLFEEAEKYLEKYKKEGVFKT